ncbi:uncharacterized protein VICG_01675 [Vittaforma corneae ATCC 50505]|uniref:Major facilitator superfamily (MFS) profile domain-containing protein n=1 Tax=Vittaforma corneae (strain ATCC 50505) TaxID=993615 RepID=L2GLY0_VITCO|nr:uncharacterized protein VICG_01675 [Vittaforma corneae ATCC 50505]ELA41302.1 hypothetical protein VICG_01675 [Vittaforma corneae ATCC 50505]
MQRFDKLSDISDKKRPLRFKDVYSAITPTLLEFMYGASVLTVQAISASSMANFGMEESKFLALCFGVLFTGATISHIFFYIFQCKFRRAFIVTSYSFAVGLLCSAFYQNLIAILIGRFLIGFAAGIIVSYLPTYLCELSPTSFKPFFSALNVCGFASGILVFNLLYSFIVKYYFWSMISMAVLCFILPVFLYMCIVFKREN